MCDVKFYQGDKLEVVSKLKLHKIIIVYKTICCI